jgi:3-keto-disaccharide hydrolase
MNRKQTIALLALATFSTTSLPATPREFPLITAEGLLLHNVQAKPATLENKRGLLVTFSGEAKNSRAPLADQPTPIETLAVIEGTDFTNGVIEAEIAGAPAPDAPEAARGFVGIAFRVKPDLKTYDAFYLRPTNGRADDQVRRNHSAQYISPPDWNWPRFRKESPERYESYVDLEAGKWTRIRIEVDGDHARLYVHGQSQPTLVVNDLKTGAQGRGAIALWTHDTTVAHFRALRVTPR